MSEAEEEHARQIYQAFRNELGEEGRHMGESELRQEVDAFLKLKGITLLTLSLRKPAEC
jgi:hypothetical protein